MQKYGFKILVLIIIICSVTILISACTSSSNLVKDASFKEPMPMVILPFENLSLDLPAGELMRLFFYIGLKEKGYEVKDITETDSLLNLLGITDGGQLNSVNDDQLQEKLNSKAFLYGKLIEATYSTIGIKKTKKVTCSIRIVADGKEIWNDQETHDESGYGNLLNPVGSIMQQVVDKQFEKMFSAYAGHPLEEILEIVAYKIQDKMPGKRKEKSGWN